MKRTFLVLLGVLVLALAGNIFAQTDNQPYGSTDASATTAAETPSQPGTADSAGGTTSDSSTAPTQERTTEDPATTQGSPTQDSMPATASNLPLVLALGMTTLGGAVVLRLYRLRRAR